LVNEPTPGRVLEVDVQQLADELRAEDVTLIDVREAHEFEQVRVPGAKLIPLAQVPDRVSEFPATGRVLVICKSGGRSMAACEFLRPLGIDAVNVAGGTMAWAAAGHPTNAGSDGKAPQE